MLFMSIFSTDWTEEWTQCLFDIHQFAALIVCRLLELTEYFRIIRENNLICIFQKIRTENET